MPVPTVRGRYELDAPALRTLKDLERQGIKTQAQLESLGKTMDDLGGQRDEERLRRYAQQERDLGEAAEEMAVMVERGWKKATRHIEDEGAKQEAVIQSLQEQVEAYGRTRATAQVNVGGVAESLAELKALDKALDRIDGRVARARASTGGGGGRAFGPAGGGGGGGGAFGGAGRGARQGGAFSRGRLGSAIKYAPALLPAATSLLGGGGALLGSAGSAALGAAALAPPAIGGLGFGVGALMSVGKGEIADLQNVTKAQKAYSTAVLQYGATSKQATTAQEKLNQVMAAQGPITQKIEQNLARFHAAWQRDTRGGRQAFAGTLLNFAQGANRAERFLAPDVNQVARSTERQSGHLADFLSGNAGRRFSRVSSNIYSENLGPLEHTLENVFATFTHLEQAARPFFRDATRGIDHWTGGWRRSSSDIEGTRRKMQKMEDNLRAWIKLGGAAGRLMKDILGAGAPEGQSMVERLTNTLERWDRYVKDHPYEVRDYFHRAVQTTESLARTLGHILKLLGQFGAGLQPILQGFLSIADAANSIGIGGGLGVLLAANRYRGMLPGGMGGGRGRGGAGGAGGGPGILPIIGGGGAAGARGLDPRGRAGRLTYGEGYRYGGPVSELGPRAGLGGFARGALRYGGYLAAAQAVYGGLTTPGNLEQRVQGSLHGAIPFIHAPVVGAEARSAQGQNVERYLGKLSPNPYAARGAIEREIKRTLGGVHSRQHGIGESLADPAGLGRTKYSGLAGIEKAAAAGDSTAKGLLTRYHSLRQALRGLQADLKAMERQKAIQKADRSILDMGKAFVFTAKHLGKNRAFKEWGRNFQTEFHKLPAAGKKELARGGAMWIKQMRENGQLTRAQAHKANQQIVDDFKRMHQRVTIVNGEILTGSKKEWANISDALTSASELAKEEVDKNFTAIQLKAIGSLKSMGFSASTAKKLVHAAETGHAAGALGVAPALGADSKGNVNKAPKFALGGRMGAGGGRVPGQGLMDTVGVGNAIAGPGELMVNRHTEADHDRDARRHGLPTLAQRVRGETRRHGAPLESPDSRKERQAALGGKQRLFGGGGLHAAIASIEQLVERRFPGLTTTSTTGGGHAAGSYHYKGEAVDIAGASGTMYSAANWIKESGLYRRLVEGIHNPNLSVKNGQMVSPGFWGAATWGEHANHIHLAATGGGAVSGPFGGVGGVQSIHLKAPRSRYGAIPGALSQRAGDMYAAGLEKKVNEALAASGGAGGGIGSAGGQFNKQQIEQFWIRAGGPPGVANLAAAVALAESSGNAGVVNSIGATGLWQILVSAHQDWNSRGNLRDPLFNARAAVGISSGGTNWQPWEAYTNGNYRRFLATGGRGDFAGFLRAGGDFRTRRATGFVAGDGLGEEDVSVRPVQPRRRNAQHSPGRPSRRGAVHVEVKFGDVKVGSDVDIDKLAEKVGAKVGERVLAVLDDDAEGDDDLT